MHYLYPQDHHEKTLRKIQLLSPLSGVEMEASTFHGALIASPGPGASPMTRCRPLRPAQQRALPGQWCSGLPGQPGGGRWQQPLETSPGYLFSVLCVDVLKALFINCVAVVMQSSEMVIKTGMSHFPKECALRHGTYPWSRRRYKHPESITKQVLF